MLLKIRGHYAFGCVSIIGYVLWRGAAYLGVLERDETAETRQSLQQHSSVRSEQSLRYLPSRYAISHRQREVRVNEAQIQAMSEISSRQPRVEAVRTGCEFYRNARVFTLSAA